MVIFGKVLLSIARRQIPSYLAKRSIMTTSFNAQKALENLEENPYFEKYAKKIAKLQETSPEELHMRLKLQEDQKKQKDQEAKLKARQYSSVLNPKPALDESGQTATTKTLDDIMKVDLIRDKSPEEIAQIWAQYHMQKDVISAVIPKDTFLLMEEKFKQFKTALFPLPRSQGYEFIMCQISGTVAHLTPLLCFQVHKENAPECLNIVHYTELMDDKNLVLMRGEYDKNVIDAKEAQCLANQLQLYYGRNDESKLKLLHQLNFDPDNFKHMDLVKELENLKLS